MYRNSFVARILTLACFIILIPILGCSQTGNVQTSMAALKAGTGQLGAPKVQGSDLYFGDTKVDNSAVESVVKMNGGVATLFVKNGDQYQRAEAALKAAKVRGVKLGRYGAEVLAPQYRAEARQRAQELQPIIAELKTKGLSLAKIAGELNKRKVATPRGGRWDSLIGAECAESPRHLSIEKGIRHFAGQEEKACFWRAGGAAQE